MAFLPEQRLNATEPVLVVRRLVRHRPLDRVPELVQVVDAAPDQRPVHREHVRLPVRVERRLVQLLENRPEPVLPADVVDPRHLTSCVEQDSALLVPGSESGTRTHTYWESGSPGHATTLLEGGIEFGKQRGRGTPSVAAGNHGPQPAT